MHCQLRSADRILFDGNASMVVARSPRGEFAIMDGHAPLLAVLDRGAIRVHTDDGMQVFAARRGTLRTTGDRISLLVESGLPVEEIDLSDVATRLSALEESNAEEREYLAAVQAVKEQYG
jgi:F-type H+-transporting ATPase subunit epsilon